MFYGFVDMLSENVDFPHVDVCMLPAKQDSILCTYLALGCIAHKRKHNQTIVCQVRNESVALDLVHSGHVIVASLP